MFDDIRHIGSLQDPGKSYADLYADEDRNKLFVLLRLSSPSVKNTKYAAIYVTPKQVSAYMSSNMPIAEAFRNRPFWYAGFQDKRLYMEDIDKMRNTTRELFPYNVPFDPDLCDDEVELNLFLQRYNDKFF